MKQPATSGLRTYIGGYRAWSLFLIFGLQGCLGSSGGSEESAEPGFDFIDWNGNSNGSVILDIDGERFAVAADRKVYYLSSDNQYIRIDNTHIAEGGALFLDGTQIGAIQLVQSTNGQNVAYFIWFNSNDPYFVDIQRIQKTTFNFHPTNTPAVLASNQPDTGGSDFQSAAPISDSVTVSGTVSSVSNTEDFYTFVASSSGNYQISLYFSQYVDLDLFLYDKNSTLIASAEAPSGAQETINAVLLGNSRYYVRVLAYDVSSQSDDTAGYDLQINQSFGATSLPLSPTD